MAPHSSTLAWKIPWAEEPWRLQSMGSLRVRHDWATSLSLFTFRHSVQFSSVAQSCLTPCNPMNRSTPGLPVHHQLPEFTQTHIYQVGDAIQPAHPLSSPSPSVAPSSSQYKGLFQWVGFFPSGGQSIGASASASVLPMNIQGWFLLGLTGLISLKSKGLSKVFSSTTIRKRQFFSTQSSSWSNSHICTWLLEKP